MTRSEAIYLLKSIVTSNPNDRAALDMAVYDMGIVEELRKERDAAMDGFVKWEKSVADSYRPEIIRCKDCKYYAGEGMYCDWDIIVQYDHFYCYHAERRTDDER